ncbi:MAG: GyrI-like domain-containing protein, partial [bacterium]
LILLYNIFYCIIYIAMKFLKKLLTIVIIIALVLLLARWYLGGFSTPVVTEQKMDAYPIAYTTFTGEYKNVGPTMTKLYDALSGAGVHSTTGVGIYYDDPAVISGQNMRSDIGSVISSAEFTKLGKMSSSGYKLKMMTAGDKVVVEFPYKNSLSYMVGPIKVYPIVNAYLVAK